MCGQRIWNQVRSICLCSVYECAQTFCLLKFHVTAKAKLSNSRYFASVSQHCAATGAWRQSEKLAPAQHLAERAVSRRWKLAKRGSFVGKAARTTARSITTNPVTKGTPCSCVRVRACFVFFTRLRLVNKNNCACCVCVRATERASVCVCATFRWWLTTPSNSNNNNYYKARSGKGKSSKVFGVADSWQTSCEYPFK